jgi:oligopeptide transport system substrate-binding protein
VYSKMNFTKKILLPTLFALGLLVAACGGSNGNSPAGVSTTKAAANKQVFVRPYAQSDLKTLDPAQETDLYSAQAITMVFSGLVELDDQGKIQGALAQSYSIAPDNVTWTFHLRSGLKFSDGTALTSTDVAYSIDRALQPATKSPYAPGYLALIKDSDKLNAGKIKTIIGDSIKTPDANTVIIVTSKPSGYFLDALSVQTSYIVEKSVIDKYGANWTDHLSSGGGSGPFVVSKYTHGKEIDFTPNPYYYGAKPQLKEVVRPFYAAADTIYKAYQVDQVDFAGSIPTANLPAAEALPDHQYHLAPSLANAYYAMNYLVKPFDNIKVREAFDLALDKDAIVKDVYKGEFIASNHIVPQGMPGYNPNLMRSNGIKDTASHAALAKQLFTEGLKEDGLTLATLPPITFTVSSQGSTDARNEFAAEQQMWQSALGVSVKFDDIDFNKLLTDTEDATNNPKGIMAWGIGWIADYPDPQDWTTLQFDNGAVNNNENYGQNHSPDVTQQVQTQKLLEQADSNLNTTQRLQQYETAEQQLVNDVAWMTVYQQASPYAIKPCVQGVVINSSDITPPNDWPNIYISNATPCANTSSY